MLWILDKSISNNFYFTDHSFKVFVCWDIVYCPYRLRWRYVGLFYFFNKTHYFSFFDADFH